MNATSSLVLAPAFWLALSLPLKGADWPGYLGEGGSATAAAEDEAAVPLEWSETTNIQWKLELPGAGSSSPIVVGDRLFLTSYTGEGGDELKRQLLCVDATSGDILWQREVDGIDREDPYRGYITEHGYASNTPACDGERVYTFFGKSGLHVFDMEGEPLWNAELGTGSSKKAWGSASSPIIHGEHVIVLASDESKRIIAFDRSSGEIVWEEKAALLEQTYSTPQIMTREDGREDLVIVAPEEVWGMDPETGDLHWYAVHGLPGNISPSPVIAGDTIVINGGYPRNGRVAIRPPMKGETSADEILWDESNASYIPTPVLHGDHLYMIYDQGFALCTDLKSGEIVYKERVEEIAGAGGKNRPVYASPVLIGDRVVCVTRYGGTVVLAAKPTYEVLAHNVIADDESQFNGTPAIAAGALFLRSDHALYRIGVE